MTIIVVLTFEYQVLLQVLNECILFSSCILKKLLGLFTRF